jgi:hypothetical protein
MRRVAEQKLMIPFIEIPLVTDIQEVGYRVRDLGITIPVGITSWLDYPFQPLVQVSLGYSTTYLWLFFEVKGDFCRAGAKYDQEAVWQDSCVEFFCTSDQALAENRLAGEVVYRNFEFNVLGVALSALGTKTSRAFLTGPEMDTILRLTQYKKDTLPEEGATFDWDFCAAIPLELLKLVPGDTFRGNFYKCGDLTKQPHYLSWCRIGSNSPDFHLPQYFGAMELKI